MNALELLETLRNRAMYGDNYNPNGPNIFRPAPWAVSPILIAAWNHLACDHLGYVTPARVSTVAVFVAQCEYFAWCDSENHAGGLGVTNGDMLQGGFSIDQLGGLRPEWSAEFWQTERAAWSGQDATYAYRPEIQCACISEDAARCAQLRSHLTDTQFEAIDPDDRACECACHQNEGDNRI